MTLDEFMKSPVGQEKRVKDWAEELGVTRQFLWRLINRERYPSLGMAARIERMTDGAVTMQDMAPPMGEWK